MWKDKNVSLVFPTYNEAGSLRWAIDTFWATGVFDEIIVVNNNAAAGTSEAIAGTPAVELIETAQGYGHALRRGIRASTGDYVVLAEPDGTFLGADVFKLLAYAGEFEIVYGTRTSWDSVWEGANMGPFLRWGNWAVAKFIEILYAAPCLSDVGCTMRLIDRSAIDQLDEQQFDGGSAYGLEMLLASLLANLRIVQIPVNYLPRVGESAVTGSRWKAAALGVRMIGLAVAYRLRRRRGRLAGRPRYPGVVGGIVPPPHALRPSTRRG